MWRVYYIFRHPSVMKKNRVSASVRGREGGREGGKEVGAKEWSMGISAHRLCLP